MSLHPIPVKAVRTALAQPPQLISGRLRDTSVIGPAASAAACSSLVSEPAAGEASPAGADGAAGSLQPMKPASKATARQENSERILDLQNINKSQAASIATRYQPPKTFNASQYSHISANRADTAIFTKNFWVSR